MKRFEDAYWGAVCSNAGVHDAHVREWKRLKKRATPSRDNPRHPSRRKSYMKQSTMNYFAKL